jgi:hypothetical protein
VYHTRVSYTCIIVYNRVSYTCIIVYKRVSYTCIIIVYHKRVSYTCMMHPRVSATRGAAACAAARASRARGAEAVPQRVLRALRLFRPPGGARGGARGGLEEGSLPQRISVSCALGRHSYPSHAEESISCGHVEGGDVAISSVTSHDVTPCVVIMWP